MTDEEKIRRSQDANVNFIRKNICDHTGNKSYVFISYKSDDWEIVLHDIVYRLVKEYGLNVYFDGSFDTHNSLWTKQFPKNMSSCYCKGVLAFFDDKYVTSYAALMELMYSQTENAGLANDDIEGLPIIPIDLDELTKITGESAERNTGLGVRNYKNADGKLISNVNCENEKNLFSESFNELVDRGPLKDCKYTWNPNKKFLTVGQCSRIMKKLREYKEVSDNYYSPGMNLDGIVGSIKDACGEEVFSKVPPLVSAAESVREDEHLQAKKSTTDINKPADNTDNNTTAISEKIVVSTLEEKSQNTSPKAGMWEYNTKGVTSRLNWDGETKGSEITVLKGSVAAKPSELFKKLPAARLREQLENDGVILKNGEFVRDFKCDKPATIMNLLNGGSVSTPAEKANGHLRKISDIVPASVSEEKTSAVPEEKPEDVSSEAVLWEYKAKGVTSRLIWNGDTKGSEITVLKGSVAARPSELFKKLPAARLREQLENDGIILKNGEFVQDFKYHKPATIMNLLNGGSVSTPAEKANGHLRMLNADAQDDREIPEKKSRGRGKSSKEGLGEILNNSESSD